MDNRGAHGGLARLAPKINERHEKDQAVYLQLGDKSVEHKIEQAERAESPGSFPGGTPIVKRIRRQEFFKGSTRVLIEHNGATYQLQITSQGKLLLTK